MEDKTSIAIIIAFSCLVMFVFVLAIIVFMLMHQRRMLQKERALKALEQEKQIEVFKASSLAEEKEKQRIASNLHDEINPQLALLKQSLARYGQNQENINPDPDTLSRDLKRIDKIIEGIRSSSYDLVPSYLMHFGLLHSLKDFFRDLREDRKIKTGFELLIPIETALPFSKHQELQLYRMCLEVTQNTLKHSGCSLFNCAISSDEKQLHIEFTHNGKGISNKEVESKMHNSQGLGLKSLQARALLLGAKLNYALEPGLASVSISMPLAQ